MSLIGQAALSLGKNVDSTKLNRLLYAYSSTFEYGVMYDHHFGICFGNKSQSEMKTKVYDSMQEANLAAEKGGGNTSLRVR